jgi:heme exporter protein B
MKQCLAILRKDIQVELGGSSRLWPSIFFALLITALGGVAFEGSNNPRIAVAMICITIVFTSAFLVHGSLSDEKRRGLINAYLLAGISAETIWLAKSLFNWLLIFIVGIATLGFTMLFYNLDVGPWLLSAIILIMLTTYGLASLGTLFSAMLGEGRLGMTLFPILFYPMILPLVIPAIYASQRLLIGAEMEALHFIVVFDLVATALGFFFAQFLLED